METINSSKSEELSTPPDAMRPAPQADGLHGPGAAVKALVVFCVLLTAAGILATKFGHLLQAHEQSASQGHATTYAETIDAGSVICLSWQSALKYRVILRANNPYVPMPEDCMVAPRAVYPTDIRHMGRIGVVRVLNPGATAYAYVPEEELHLEAAH
jgi:hypothetical protein